jgi:copper transport protein
VSRRRAAVAALAVLAVLAAPATALAHATLTGATPSVQGRVEQSPRTIVLEFDQAVTPTSRSIEVRSVGGRLVSGPVRSGRGGRLLIAPLRGPLPRGGYTVRWQALSADGHVGSGVFTFGVRTDAPPPSEAYGSSGPSLSDDLIRWGLFVSLSLLLGALAFRLVALRGAEVSPRVERRLLLVAGVGVVATLETGIAGFVMRAEDALQLPFERLLYGDLSPLATETRFGQAFVAMTLGYALVAALVFLAWLTDRTALLWPALAVGLLFAGGLSLSGHSAVEPNASVLSELADWVHLCAAAIWAGGLVSLAVAVWPAAPELRRQAFLGFSKLATVAIGLLVVAGLYLAILRLPHLDDLWGEDYGRVLLVKLGLVSLALAWGGAHKLLVAPRLARGDEGGGRLRRSLLGESLVGMAVLLVAAILVNSAPPPRPAPIGGAAATVPR